MGTALRLALCLLTLLSALLTARLEGATLLIGQASLKLGAQPGFDGSRRGIPDRCRRSPGRGILGILPSIPFRQTRRIKACRVFKDLNSPGSVLARCRFRLLHKCLSS
jgi:hypothetical protein